MKSHALIGVASILLLTAVPVTGETIIDFADPSHVFNLESGKYADPSPRRFNFCREKSRRP